MTNKKPLSEVEAELYEKLAPKGTSALAVAGGWHNDEPYWIVVNKNGYILKERLTKSDVKRACKTHITVVTVADVEEAIMTLFPSERREPTLNDVLLKIGEVWNIHAYCDACGNVGYPDDGIGKMRDKLICRYDLIKSFDNQTEDTKRAIYSLVCK